MLNLALTAWRLLVRAKGFQAVFLLAFVSTGAGALGGKFSARQQGVVFFDLMHSAARIGLLILAAVWVLELLSKEIDRKSVLFQLSFPYSRTRFLFARFLALSAMLLAAAVTVFVLALCAAPFLGWSLESLSANSTMSAYAVSILGLWLELSLVGAFMLLIATVATSLAFPMIVGLAFAVAGRLVGHVSAYLAAGADGDAELVDRFSAPVALIRYLLPDLSALDFRVWYLYGSAPDFGVLASGVTSAILYLAATLCLGILVFDRRQFN